MENAATKKESHDGIILLLFDNEMLLMELRPPDEAIHDIIPRRNFVPYFNPLINWLLHLPVNIEMNSDRDNETFNFLLNGCWVWVEQWNHCRGIEVSVYGWKQVFACEIYSNQTSHETMMSLSEISTQKLIIH